MKLNKILMALSAMAIVGCSSEDFNDPSVTQAIDDSRLIQLDENFILAGVGEVDNTTRTHWEQDSETGAFVNKFLPIWAKAGTATTDYIYKVDDVTNSPTANLEAQAVGLCWLGNGAAGTDVYTNYEFYHFGWLNKGETEADLDKCGSLYNGSLYNEITLKANVVAEKEAVPGTDWDKTTIPEKSSKNHTEDILNYNSGVYKTDNKAIFSGQYIVYYPYNKDFTDAGTIPAVAETNWKAAPVDDVVDEEEVKGWMAPEIGKATFRYSAPVEIKGGHQAANFGLKNLSAIAQLRVATAAGELTGAEIDQIVLYSPSEKLLKKAYLAADKIKAGAKGAGLYASTEGTKTIVANPQKVIKFKANGTPDRSAYITVLPTTVDDLVALVHNRKDGGKWAQISLGNKEFKAGSAKRLDIVVKAADFTTDFIAVDEASLTASLKSARDAAGDAPYKPQTITVIGDITLEAKTANDITVTTPGTYNINVAQDAAITIKGDDIIVPEKVTLNLKTNMESDVRVLGTYCCGGATIGGRVDVKGGTISNVTLEPSEARVTAETYDALNPQITYSDAATVAAGKTIDVQAGKVEVNAAVAHKGNIKIAEGAIVTVNLTGGLNFMGSNVTNDGTIEVKANGKFDMTDANGNAHATDGKRMTNNGTFIHNVDAAVGTAVQSMNQNGEYRCKVSEQAELDDAYQKWLACSVIEIVAAPTGYNLGVAKAIAYQHKGKYIDIEVNSDTNVTTFNNDAQDDEEIMVGNLTVKTGGLFIDFVKESGSVEAKNYKIGKRTLTVNGDMTVAAEGKNTTISDSKKVNITGNLNINKGKLIYSGPHTPEGENKQNNEEGLAVAKDINVNGAQFVAQDDALNITCANFYLKSKGQAKFGNRTAGDAKNMVVSGTIDNPKGCKFTITAAPAAGGKLQAWVSCTELKVGGTFEGAMPQVVE